jgi:hypothetical protein
MAYTKAANVTILAGPRLGRSVHEDGRCDGMCCFNAAVRMSFCVL